MLKCLLAALLLLAPTSAMPDRRPLLLGASVSADYSTKSPGRLLSEDALQSPSELAYIGDKGSLSRLLGELSDEKLRQSNIVYSLDSLFWDTFKPAAVGVGALEGLLSRTKAAGVPVVLGNAPKIDVPWVVRLVAGAAGPRQVSADEVNARAAELCTPANNCTLMDILSRVRDASEADMPDGLHPSPEFSRRIADEIRGILDGN